MHDTFLFEKITNEVFNLCLGYKIKRLSYVKVSVNEDSHIDAESLLQYFKETNNPLVGEWTKVVVDTNNPERLMAIVHQIQGDEIETSL